MSGANMGIATASICLDLIEHPTLGRVLTAVAERNAMPACERPASTSVKGHEG
jgi:hypothetical protein